MKSSLLILTASISCSPWAISGWVHHSPGQTFHRGTSLTLSSTTTATATATAAGDGLQQELTAKGLGLCHGVFHASGVRTLSDVQHLTEEQIADMGIDNFDRRDIQRVQKELVATSGETGSNSPKLSTDMDGAFSIAPESVHDFGIKAIAPGIYKGRLFTTEQCNQLNRMAEYHDYSCIGSFGGGWTNELYTLTDQHLQCKDVPGMVSTTDQRFQELFTELYDLFPGRLVPNSIGFESEGEPHLVKYNGKKAKGTKLHTDNSKFLSITINAALSASEDYTGGGTYFTALDDTVSLQQGEMLIHLGDAEHAGTEITSGVRRLFVAFLACEWKDEALNRPNTNDDAWQSNLIGGK